MTNHTILSIAVKLSIAAWTTACFSPSEHLPGAPIEPPLDLFTDQTADAAPCVVEMPSGLMSADITVRTSAPGGRFAPKNVGAIWIETDAGEFVHTLARWGVTRAKWLSQFGAATGGNVVDAVTAATRLSHTTHEVSWNLTDVQTRCEVPAGDYVLWIETTDRSGAGPFASYPFTKSRAATTFTFEDQPTFHQVTIDLH